jgi:hypothetical protein
MYERKLDGIRCLAFKRDRKVRLFSRTQLDLNLRFAEISCALQHAAMLDCVLDGEVVALSGGRRVSSGCRWANEAANVYSDTRFASTTRFAIRLIATWVILKTSSGALGRQLADLFERLTDGTPAGANAAIARRLTDPSLTATERRLVTPLGQHMTSA